MDINEIVNYFKILADETRVKIIHYLKNDTLCACDMLEKLYITQPTLSYHMKILFDNKLVTCEKKGVWVNYTINQEKLNEISKFLLSNECVCTENSCYCKGNK